MTPILFVVARLHALAGRLADAAGDDRGEINSSVAWAGLMLVVAVAVHSDGGSPREHCSA